jgi:hypothetical protein
VDHQLVTDEDLARARRDPAFRKQLIAHNLDHLLGALARLRASEAARQPEPARQLKEGAQLAVKLADMLQRFGGRPVA